MKSTAQFTENAVLDKSDFEVFYEMDAGLKAMVTCDRNETYLLVGHLRSSAGTARTMQAFSSSRCGWAVRSSTREKGGITSMSRPHSILLQRQIPSVE